jgi:hypothetical protein
MSSSLCSLDGVTWILCTSHASRIGFVAAICAASVIAGQNAFAANVMGVVTESSQASIGGLPALRGQTVLSGDSMLAGDGAAIILLADSTKVIVRRDTEVSFQRAQDGAALALLARGDLSFAHDGDNPEIRVRTGNVTIRPASHLRTLGVVTIRDGALQIAATAGSVRVEGAGLPVEIPEGRAVQFQSQGDTGGGGQPGQSPSATAGSTGTNWGRLVLCGLVGGAVGSIPVIVKERESVSTDVAPIGRPSRAASAPVCWFAHWFRRKTHRLRRLRSRHRLPARSPSIQRRCFSRTRQH